MKNNKIDPFGKILNFLTGKKQYLNKKEAEKIFYSRESRFKKALQEISKTKKIAKETLQKNTEEDLISTIEQIALTVKIK